MGKEIEKKETEKNKRGEKNELFDTKRELI